MWGKVWCSTKRWISLRLCLIMHASEDYEKFSLELQSETLLSIFYLSTRRWLSRLSRFIKMIYGIRSLRCHRAIHQELWIHYIGNEERRKVMIKSLAYETEIAAETPHITIIIIIDVVFGRIRKHPIYYIFQSLLPSIMMEFMWLKSHVCYCSIETLSDNLLGVFWGETRWHRNNFIDPFRFIINFLIIFMSVL